MSKKLKIFEGGSAKLKSYNPYDGGTVEFKGKSHEKGGIKMSFDGNLAEVEGGETAVNTPDGGLMIMGNMKIPNTNTRFKEVSKALAKKESGYQRLFDKGHNLISEHDVVNKFDRLKFKTGALMIDGADLGQRDIAKKKQELSTLQQIMLNTANQLGIDPISMSEGKVKKMRSGGKIKADGGLKFDTEDPFVKSVKKAIGFAESENDYSARNEKTGSTAFGKYQFVKDTRKGIWEKHLKNQFKTFDDFEKAYATNKEVQETVMDKHIADLRAKYGDNIEAIALVHRLGPKGYERVRKNPELLNQQIYKSVPESTDTETPKQYLEKIRTTFDTPDPASSSNFKIKPPEVSTVTQNVVKKLTPAPTPPDFTEMIFNNPDMKQKQSPSVKKEDGPSDEYTYNTNTKKAPIYQTPFDPLQVAPEVMAIAMNKYSGVPAQKFTPDLFEQYQVSFQDQLNENQATFNAAARVAAYNPGLLGQISAEKFAADGKIMAEEFRINQQIQNEITNKNIELLNTAKLKNLEIADNQMVRQAQAKSNTKQVLQAAFNSMASKYLQHKAVNSELGFYQEMFDYRPSYDETGNYQGLTYMGPSQTFGNNPQSQLPAEQHQSRSVQRKVGDGFERVNTPSLVDQRRKEIQLMKESSPNKLLKIFGIKN
jgi:hypothetical protein